MYEGTWESLRTHRVPDWYDDAKLGIFIHWGLYSVPGWAPRVPDIQQLLIHDGPKRMLRENPYAEWYRNTMQITGSPTHAHHAEVYGEDYPYDNFVRTFDDASSGADLDAIAALCQDAGARYVVLTTKHHDGFALWPSSVAHPVKGEYRARRDLVGDLSEAVRGRRMRMGLYYSGGYDWPYNDAVMTTGADAVLAAPYDARYVAYVRAHVRELIARYQPSVLWNDISWPPDPELPQLFADYYNAVEEGVINDRWKEPGLARNAVTDTLVRAAGAVVQALWPYIPAQRKHLTFATPKHYDFRTPEYDVLRTATPRKWELARGVGHSFGANRHERPEDIITETDLIQMFCDVVAKNGNLLIGVGPRPDGTIPELQQAPLRGLGAWLAVNGEAIYGSRPWVVTESTALDGTPLRFTKSGEGVYALVFGPPPGRRLSMPSVDGTRVRRVRLVGSAEPLEWSVEDGGDLSVTLPPRLPATPVTALDLGADVRARIGRTSLTGAR
ncbi:MAG: alpha-L-fucosidase [Acidimicrobiales bacterium]